MAKTLKGNVVIYWGGEIIRPGDELPADLAKLNPALAGDVADEPADGGTGPGGGAPADPGFDVEKATVPQLRDELNRLEVEFADSDRKDALQAKYREKVGAQA